MGRWRYDALGANRLWREGEEVTEAEVIAPPRKTAALLAYLALEGPTPRSRLAGLLWPDADERTARNNLAQSLRRLKDLAGGGLIVSLSAPRSSLTLAAALEVDAARLKAAALAGRAAEVAEVPGELLAPFDFDDAPEFTEWLWAAREALGALRRDALTGLVTSLEARGDLRGALRRAEGLVQLEPISEAAHRHLMRLHYGLGDRPAALGAYRRLKALLAREVGVAPLPETEALAERIEQGTLQRPAAAPPQPLPPTVLRPPTLVGREREWAAMAAAWERGQLIVLSGDPGIGKTRLATDFAEHRGATFYLGARPGDAVVPHASMLRSVRRTLAEHPEMVLEPWVRRALAPLMPELEEPAPQSAPNAGGSVPDALLRVMQLGSKGVSTFLYDDMQFADATSIREGFYFFSSAFPLGDALGIPRWILLFRRGELAPNAEGLLGELVAAGHAVHLELGPLSSASVRTLLDELKVPGTETLAPSLERFTGGNPLFVLETVRHLLETGGLGAGIREGMPLPNRVSSVVRRRLERLSPAALRVAQAAATLQSDFDPGLVGALLKQDALALLEPWEELERAQLLTPTRFTHDLLYEAVRAGTSPSVAALLHQRAAEVLGERRASPLRVAKHWLGAGDRERAAHTLLGAAEQAQTEGHPEDAGGLLERAAELLQAGGDEAAAARVRAARAQLEQGA